MTPKERKRALELRRMRHHPWHSPPHRDVKGAVHHGYVEHWQDWPYSSAREYLEQVGRERAAEIWRTYPILDYGKKWDT